jgi:hypothetical protein
LQQLCNFSLQPIDNFDPLVEALRLQSADYGEANEYARREWNALWEADEKFRIPAKQIPEFPEGRA